MSKNFIDAPIKSMWYVGIYRLYLDDLKQEYSIFKSVFKAKTKKECEEYKLNNKLDNHMIIKGEKLEEVIE